MTAPKTTTKTVKPEVGTLIPRPNGRGALRHGGTNKGGPGRPPDWIGRAMKKCRERAVTLIDKRLTKFENGDLIRVVEKFAPKDEQNQAKVRITVGPEGDVTIEAMA